MSEKKNNFPKTKVKNPEPKINDPDWIVWAAWADRITFEEIFEKTGKRESEVIKIMRRSLKPVVLDFGEKEFTLNPLRIENYFQKVRKNYLSKKLLTLIIKRVKSILFGN